MESSGFSDSTKNYMKLIIEQGRAMLFEMYNDNKEICDRINQTKHSLNYEP